MRIEDRFITKLEPYLHDMTLLEVGCGDGVRTEWLSKYTRHITAIDIDLSAIASAQNARSSENITFCTGDARKLQFDDSSFDAVAFTNSFHHNEGSFRQVLDEAIRVVLPNGILIFVEPAFDATFFLLEERFGCCDGDERRQKACAYCALLSHPDLVEIEEFYGHTVFEFESWTDFQEVMRPTCGTLSEARGLLESNDFRVTARKRVNVFKTKYK